jgi:hypothetical protein
MPGILSIDAYLAWIHLLEFVRSNPGTTSQTREILHDVP